jgi:coenzyme PQQ synthesis protein D (PqqD)
MRLASSSTYETPSLASFYRDTSPKGRGINVVTGQDGTISLGIGAPWRSISVRRYVKSTPRLKHKRCWILDSTWAAVFHTRMETPFFLNDVARRLCSLCNGKNTLSDVLQAMAQSYPEQPCRQVMMDSIRFLALLKDLDLLWMTL